MAKNMEHEETTDQMHAKNVNTIIEDLRKASARADQEGWISDDEMQKIMKD